MVVLLKRRRRRRFIIPEKKFTLSSDKFRRQTHRTSRVLEYFSEKEIQMQIGVTRKFWPIAIVKELIDNALDACEDANILPRIEVSIDDAEICIKDNGPGLPRKTVEESLDFLYRVSDKSHYVSPSRGQLGNALKTIYAIPFIVNGSGGVDIATNEGTHRIEFSLNLLNQSPEVKYNLDTGAFIKSGTNFKVRLDLQACLKEGETIDSYKRDVFELVRNYALFNPHASFIYAGWRGGFSFERTSNEINKWCPSDKIPIYWYSEERLRNLIAANIYAEAHGGRVRTVREFISEFRGYTSPKKQQMITNSGNLHLKKGTYLNEFVKDNDVDMDRVKQLLKEMTLLGDRILKPRALGKVGEEHIKSWMVNDGVVPASINYQLKYGEQDDLPYALEVGFGIFEDKQSRREIITGLNWAPTLKDPLAMIQGQTTEALIDEDDPVLLVIHLVYPQFKFTGKGKGEIEL